MRRGGVRLQRVRALPFLDHDKGVGAELGLKAADAVGVDSGAVFDAAVLGVDRRHVGMKFREDRVAHSGLGGNDGNDMDHGDGPPQAMRSKTLWWRLVVKGRI